MMKKDLIISYLDELFPDAKAELNFTNHFELIVAVVLSAQTTDVSVNKVTEVLFKKYPTPALLAQASQHDVEQIIRHIGLYHNKAKNIIALANDLENLHQGVVPNDRKALEALPGVGRKTANVVLSNAFNVPAFAVDTHVNRVSKRLAIAKDSDSVLIVEQKLNEFFPRMSWHKLHHQMIFFGRYHCTSRKPKCDTCALQSICKYYKDNYS